jgi:8-oxo-dGTP diphosphatase
MKYIHAVIGVVFNNKRVLLSKRQAHQSYAGYWEFPGGKIEELEDHATALERELAEELGIELLDYEFVATVDYVYIDQKVKLEVFKINSYKCLSGASTNIDTDNIGREGQQVCWQLPSDIKNLKPILEASFKILEAL